MQETARECLYIDRLFINNHNLCKKKCYWCFTASTVHFGLKLQWFVCTATFLDFFQWTYVDNSPTTSQCSNKRETTQKFMLHWSLIHPQHFLTSGIMKKLPQNPKIDQIKTNATWGLGFYFASSDMLFQGSEWSNEMCDLEKTVHFASFPDKKNVWHTCQCYINGNLQK